VTRGGIRAVVAWVFGVAVVSFGTVFVVSRWEELFPIIARIGAGSVGLASLFASLAGLCGVLAWREIWPAFGARFSLIISAKYFFVSQVGKYIPGSVWSIAAQAHMTTRWRIPVRTSVIVGLVALAVSIAVALALGSASVFLLGEQVRSSYWWVAALAIVLAAALAPPALTRLVSRGLAILRRPPARHMNWTWGQTSRMAVLNLGFWLFAGAHFWVILVALGADPVSSLVPAVAGFAVSFALGVMFIPAPAGIGVREVALVLFLSSVVGENDAIAAALVSRIVLAFVDFVWAGVGALLPTSDLAVVVAVDDADQ
jgi:hypothetical protein